MSGKKIKDVTKIVCYRNKLINRKFVINVHNEEALGRQIVRDVTIRPADIKQT